MGAKTFYVVTVNIQFLVSHKNLISSRLSQIMTNLLLNYKSFYNSHSYQNFTVCREWQVLFLPGAVIWRFVTVLKYKR